jgi:hypothetical protein
VSVWAGSPDAPLGGGAAEPPGTGVRLGSAGLAAGDAEADAAEDAAGAVDAGLEPPHAARTSAEASAIEGTAAGRGRVDMASIVPAPSSECG